MSIGVLYEHPEWFVPLFRALEHRGVAYERVDAAALAWNPSVTPAYHLLFNRMSPSAYLRGHAHAIRATSAYLDYISSRGIPIVNGREAYALELSKSRQLDLLQHLGVRHPTSRVINDAARALEAAAELRFPVLVKPNIGGSGARIQRFDTIESLDAAATEGRIDLGIDGIALVQELLPARGGSFTRIEILEGEILYAIRMTPPPGHGFNLCPADICRTPADAPAGFCPAKPSMAIEATTIPAAVAEQALATAAVGGLDICGIEYLIDDRDGNAYVYDINALSNFVTDAPAIVGFDPYERLVNYLAARLAEVAAV